jgi:hypothetical protein
MAERLTYHSKLKLRPLSFPLQYSHHLILHLVILLGESWTGKSNIFTRIIKDSFSAHTSGTIALNYAKKSFPISNDSCVLGMGLVFSLLS